MFGRFLRRHDAPPTASVSVDARAAPGGEVCAGPAALPSAVAEIEPPGLLDVARQVRARIRADRRDAREVARLVVAEIQSDPLDIYWTHAEMRAWIARTATRHGIDLELIRHAHLVEAIKARPDVDYYEIRIKSDPRFEALRCRLRMARGRIPEKCWIFEVADSGRAIHDAPETVSAVVVAKHLDRDAALAAGQSAAMAPDGRSGSGRAHDPAASLLRSPMAGSRSPTVQNGIRAGVRGGVEPESGVISGVAVDPAEHPAGFASRRVASG